MNPSIDAEKVLDRIPPLFMRSTLSKLKRGFLILTKGASGRPAAAGIPGVGRLKTSSP